MERCRSWRKEQSLCASRGRPYHGVGNDARHVSGCHVVDAKGLVAAGRKGQVAVERVCARQRCDGLRRRVLKRDDLDIASDAEEGEEGGNAPQRQGEGEQGICGVWKV